MKHLVDFLDFLTEEVDPKVGTGKKPKNSSRRLYTDENPKDTVPVKFRTKEDIVQTVNSKSFKSKSHKRQSQILNLIEQRLRVSLRRAKDPDTKKRLERAYEYIKSKCEASKEKTKRMNESAESWREVTSTDYWRSTEKSDMFTKYEYEKIQELADKHKLRLINWSFGTSVRLERVTTEGPHKVLWSISIVKSEDEWFWVFFNSVRKQIEGEDEDFYKADQLDGLLDLLNYLIDSIIS